MAEKTYELYSPLGVHFAEAPKEKAWGGIQVAFQDLCGNSYALVQVPSLSVAG